ncbi:TetR/AcrR family transcriptional regulator [Nocardiopsis mangrovi]|uniref:TetR/AcrR family transcriptional regulator n=1 Tax=Nocardiopsis mangrovi TaxID=1179818 RepID=A0ABV9DRF3_9ACTN
MRSRIQLEEWGNVGETDARRTGTRRRGAELIRAIHEAAIGELLEAGLGRLTMEGIARRAGTAKTSLYRRWSSPHELLLDAFRREFPQEEPSPSADDLRGDLIRSLELMRAWLTSPTARAMAAIMTERERHPELVDAVYRQVFDAKGGRFTRTVLLHYAERGEFDRERVTPVVADIGEALMLKYSLDSNALPDDEAIAAIVDQAILPALGLHGLH